MERRGCSLGCIIAGLGLLLSCCLLPYLLSSIYSIVTALLQVEGVPDWLWGDWINSLVGDSGALYIILSEGPICCVGALGLLVVVLGLVLGISGVGGQEQSPAAGADLGDAGWNEFDSYAETDDPDGGFR